MLAPDRGGIPLWSVLVRMVSVGRVDQVVGPASGADRGMLLVRAGVDAAKGCIGDGVQAAERCALLVGVDG